MYALVCEAMTPPINLHERFSNSNNSDTRIATRQSKAQWQTQQRTVAGSVNTTQRHRKKVVVVAVVILPGVPFWARRKDKRNNRVGLKCGFRFISANNRR
jgi:hypothetical protein